ncbi:MAG: Gfo/Idh/MocA family protein [Fimbriimonadaceae bacterium]
MQQVRVGIIGCGGFTRYRLGNLAKVKEAEVVALVDPSPEQIKLTKEAHPHLAHVPEFADENEMLASIKPDAIMIATPHTQHVDQILAGLQAGCHVCCEKPLITSVADAFRIIEARDKAKKVGMVSYQRHFQSEFRFIRERIASGHAGKVNFISAFQAQGWLTGTKGTWRQQHSLSGGGQLNDSGSHLVDILLWTSGLKAKSVGAVCESFGTEVDIDTTASIQFTNGGLGSLSIIGSATGWHEDITFACEKESYYMRQGKLTLKGADGVILEATSLPGGTTPDKHFIDSILGKVECESPFESGLEVIRLTEAAWQSSEKGGVPVHVKY